MAKQKSGINWGKFEPVEQVERYHLIYRSFGWDKTGKNHFGFTMPGPILGLYFDPGGTKGVVEKFLKGDGVAKREIRARHYRFNKARDSQDDAIERKEQFVEDFYHALEVARSIQWDETETWEMFRHAEFGRESGVQRDYGPLNGLYRNMIQAAYDANVNLQLIQKVKVKYKNDKPTDELNPQGFQMAGNLVQVSLEHSFDEDEEGDERFRVKIIKARQRTDIWGEAFGNMTFQQLGTLIYPESNEEDWE